MDVKYYVTLKIVRPYNTLGSDTTFINYFHWVTNINNITFLI